MFKTPPEFQFDQPDTSGAKEYVIRSGDIIQMQILSNNGYQLVDVLGRSGYAEIPYSYLVRADGLAAFPLLDSVTVVGLTTIELQNYLADRYAYYFLNPFIKLNVSNRRVIVFNGRSVGHVITLENEQTQLIEAIAAAGGITGSKAYRVKVIRGAHTLSRPQVYLFDFSTVEGATHADFLVTNNDIVYVEPSLTLIDVNNKILPVLSTLSTLFLIYTTINNVSK